MFQFLRLYYYAFAQYLSDKLWDFYFPFYMADSRFMLDKLYSSSSMANRPSNCNSPRPGNFITILTVDGCGIQDVILTTMLSFLESELQALDGEDARLADYFDIVGGTSTGGLMTAMLTTPDENNRPLFAAKDIKEFYLNHAFEISPQHRRKSANLDKLIREKFGNTKLHQTLTNVVIPAFKPNILDLVVFSSYGVEVNPTLDAMLSDICIATLPSPGCRQTHSFTIKDDAGNAIGEQKVIDGGVAVNNSALVAMREVFLFERSSSRPKFLVLSLGSGSKKLDNNYAGTIAGSLNSQLNVSFKFLGAGYNYLHIQDDISDVVVSSNDVVSKEILDRLVRVGDYLLKMPVSKVGLELDQEEAFFKLKHLGGSNADALKRFAKLLSAEKRSRSPAAIWSIAQVIISNLRCLVYR